MADYCTILLNQAHKSDVLAACIQAEAALKAGWLSFYAGVCALFGALLAGVLAYRAATTQNREIRNQRSAREAAYLTQICALAIDANDEVIRVILDGKDARGDALHKALEGLSFVNLCLLRDELGPLNWEKHALLGHEHLDQLVSTHFCTRSFMDHINKLNLHPPAYLDIRLDLSAALAAKAQCESLMSALAPKAPPALQAFLAPIKLQSVQTPR